MYHDELTDEQLHNLRMRRPFAAVKKRQSVDTRAKALAMRRSDPTYIRYNDAEIARACGVSRMRIHQIFTDRFNIGDNKNRVREPQSWIKSRYADEEWFKNRKFFWKKRTEEETPWAKRKRKKKESVD